MNHADRNTRKLHHWLIRMAGDGGGRVSLGHLSAAGPGVPLGQWAVRQEDDDAALKQLAESIVCAAADDADGQSGGTPQQYVALFYMEETPDQPASRLPFRLSNAEQFAPEGSALATEPPTEKGLISQTIRHNEFLVRTSFGALGSAASQLERHNHMLADQVARLTEQVFEMQRERQELLDRDTDRLLEMERFEAETKQRERVTNAVLSAGKGFVGMLANGGKPLQLPVSTVTTGSEGGGDGGEASGEPETVPAAAVVALDQLQDLFRSLTPEQTQAIAGALTPVQLGSLMMLYHQFAGPEDGEESAGDAGDDGAEA